MDVPNFWTPHYAWTYLEEDEGRGSPNWVAKEKERCEAYTFDYMRTNVAYYRQYLLLPEGIESRISYLNFDGIGKDAEIWVNGQAAGVHSGLFTPTRLEVSGLVRPGLNVITVKVGDFSAFDITDIIVPGVADREAIDNKSSQNYPNGMLFSQNLGIWQG
jgi:beta-galactosidase/beta-glucuronidase